MSAAPFSPEHTTIPVPTILDFLFRLSEIYTTFEKNALRRGTNPKTHLEYGDHEPEGSDREAQLAALDDGCHGKRCLNGTSVLARYPSVTICSVVATRAVRQRQYRISSGKLTPHQGRAVHPGISGYGRLHAPDQWSRGSAVRQPGWYTPRVLVTSARHADEFDSPGRTGPVRSK